MKTTEQPSSTATPHSCHYCGTSYTVGTGVNRHCPLCRHTPLDNSGKHTPTTITKLPINYTTTEFAVSVGRLAYVTIAERGSFMGRIVSETTTGYNIIPNGVEDAAEWFAKKSAMVNTVVLPHTPTTSEASK